MLNEKFNENDMKVDAILLEKYFVYKSIMANQSYTCPMACILDSKCLYFFMRDSPKANCYIGNFKEGVHESERLAWYTNIAKVSRAVETPSENVRLRIKGAADMNITSSIINAFEFSSRSPIYGQVGSCPSAGIHIIFSQDWTLPISLIYPNVSSGYGCTMYSRNCYCTFTLVKAVAGKLVLSIPHFNVSHLYHFEIVFVNV